MLEKVIAWTKKNQLWVIFGLSIIIVSALLIWAILSSRENNQPTPVTLIEVPLNNRVNHRPFINRDIVENTQFPEALPVYKLIERNYSSTVDTFLNQLNKGGMTKSSVQGRLYTWIRGEEYVEYIPNLQTLYFNFTDAADTGINTRVINAESGRQYLEEFYQKFFSRDYDFTDVSAVQTGNRIRIQASRVVNELPLNLSTYEGYTDYVVIDTNGNLIEGKLLVVEYEMSNPDVIKLVHISNLQRAMNSLDYPKTVVQGYNPIIGELSDEEPHTDEEGETHGDVTEESSSFPIATSSNTESAKLVYLFTDSGAIHLSPVYKLEGEGSVVFKGQSITIPVIVYTNALIPDRVYIPD